MRCYHVIGNHCAAPHNRGGHCAPDAYPGVVNLHGRVVAVQGLLMAGYVYENRGRIALMRGPLIYCVEGADYPDLDVRDLVLTRAAPLRAEEHPDLLGGVVLLHGTAQWRRLAPAWQEQLYRPGAPLAQAGDEGPVPLVALPYFAWANRAPGGMQVWLRAQASDNV